MIPKFIFRQKQERIPEKEELMETICTRFKTCYQSTVKLVCTYIQAHESHKSVEEKAQSKK